MKATVSLDLDNLWTYLKARKDPQWETYPSYLQMFIPYCLDLLDELGLKITFFVVGRDVLNHGELICKIHERGHEVANHTFSHPENLHLQLDIETEILKTDEAICKITGEKPVGFRGPNFSRGPAITKVLLENGYLYDSSTLPTFLGPLLRCYYGKSLFGPFSDGLLSNKNQYTTLCEFPVTTIPLLKLPFHMSYLLFLREYSKTLMHAYLNTAIYTCRLTRTAPNFLLHPTDLISPPELHFFPGMSLSEETKKKNFQQVLTQLQNHFQIVSMRELCTK